MKNDRKTEREHLSAPAVILFQPQLGGNIGSTARAMLNTGLTDLRVVIDPTPYSKSKWATKWNHMHGQARIMAAGARSMLDGLTPLPSFDRACAGITRLYGATARGRDANQRVMDPRSAAAAMRRDIAEGGTPAIVFGPESSGFDNDVASRCDALIIAGLNPQFRSLNLAQAVLLIGYEWWMQAPARLRDQTVRKGAKPALRGDIEHLFDHLESALDQGKFFASPQQKPAMMRNIRNLFLRAGLLDREVRALRGIIHCLSDSTPHQNAPKPPGGKSPGKNPPGKNPVGTPF